MKRSLEEIARRTIWNGVIPTALIDSALEEAGFDKHNDIARERFSHLVQENGQSREVIYNIDDYRNSALEAAGPTAPDSEIIAIAWNMKEDAR